MWLGALLFVTGIALVLWGAGRFTEGAVGTALAFGVSPFLIGTLVSGFEPENLVTGIAAAVGGLHQVALGTVIGAAIFLLTAGLGVALLLVPMDVNIPPAGPAAMVLSLGAFAVMLWNDGEVSRAEGVVLVLVAVALLAWLHRRSPVFLRAEDAGDAPARPMSRARALLALAVGVIALVAGAELVVEGASRLIGSLGISETIFGMTVVALGESLEETARMVVPARRGHPELAWGNVVGTVVILLGANLGVIALIQPLRVDALVLRFHAPSLVGCTLLVAVAMASAQRLGRRMGTLLLLLYAVYLVVNLRLFRAG